MNSFSLSGSITFSLTHARQLGAKVATDLKRMQRFYGSPSDAAILAFETEIVELLKDGYLDKITYGFKKGDDWIIPSLKYTALELSDENATDDDPGRVPPGADISGTEFTSFLSRNSSYWNKTDSEREAFNNKLPFQRTTGEEPGTNGYFSSDRSYSSGGRGLNRSSLKSL